MSDGWASDRAADDIDLGDGHKLTPTHLQDGTPYGWIDEHTNVQTGKKCSGAVPRAGMRPGGPGWRVISEDPLTLEPSLLCTTCGDHGFVRNGRWMKA